MSIVDYRENYETGSEVYFKSIGCGPIDGKKFISPDGFPFELVGEYVQLYGYQLAGERSMFGLFGQVVVDDAHKIFSTRYDLIARYYVQKGSKPVHAAHTHTSIRLHYPSRIKGYFIEFIVCLFTKQVATTSVEAYAPGYFDLVNKRRLAREEALTESRKAVAEAKRVTGESAMITSKTFDELSNKLRDSADALDTKLRNLHKFVTEIDSRVSELAENSKEICKKITDVIEINEHLARMLGQP